MTIREIGTVILAVCDLDLTVAVNESFPELRVLAFTANIPFNPFEGRLWCFVDWLLPGSSGLEICRRLRESSATAHGHITMVLQEDDLEARSRALRAGSDDYMIGPLTKEILVSRLRELSNNLSPAKSRPELVFGNLVLNYVSHRVQYDGKPVPLSRDGFRLMAIFLEHPDRVLSHIRLIEMLGKDSMVIQSRTVIVWVTRLRQALRAHGVPDILRTVPSLGYVFDSSALHKEA